MSKLFEHCLLHRFGYFFGTSDTVINLALNMDWAPRMPFTRYIRRVVDYYVCRNSTVNICAVDISKAFDRMNQHGLFLKLMQRKVPVVCWESVKIGLLDMQHVRDGAPPSLTPSVWQGSVLSPYLFALYVNDIIAGVEGLNVGCVMCFVVCPNVYNTICRWYITTGAIS